MGGNYRIYVTMYNNFELVYFFSGDTSVMAAVYGPADVNQRKEILDKATVEVVLKNKVGFVGR